MTDVATFRADFPEFADTSKYSDATANFWLGLAVKMTDNHRWVNSGLQDHGQELFLAHHLVLASQNAASAAVGKAPGTASGVVSNKAVDRVSVGYDTAAGTVLNAGHWNTTTYGVQFIQLARMIGSGGIQI